MACGVYCLIWYRPPEPTFLAPDIAIPCSLYCATLHPGWGAITLLSALLPLAGAVMLWRGMYRLGLSWAILSGIVLLPVGILSIVGGLLAAGHARRMLS